MFQGFDIFKSWDVFLDLRTGCPFSGFRYLEKDSSYVGPVKQPRLLGFSGAMQNGGVRFRAHARRLIGRALVSSVTSCSYFSLHMKRTYLTVHCLGPLTRTSKAGRHVRVYRQT